MRLSIIVFALLGALSCGALAQQGWRLETQNAPWMERGHHGSFVINNEMWVFSGRSASGDPQPEDGWSSSDGVNWNLQYSYSAPPNPLLWSGTLVLEFNGEIWVLGGGTSRVLRSADGVNWTQMPDAPWVERRDMAGVAYNGRMWVFGGFRVSPPHAYLYNDVWSTADGVNWTQEVAAAAWSARANHEAVVFNNRMWVIGGADGQQFTREVWSSTDGVNWVQETGNAGWEGRMSFQSVVYRNRIWLFGGEISGQHTPHHSLGDVWSSADGVNWVREMDDAPWGDRARHGAVVFDDRIWLTGGISIGNGGYLNDVWSYGLHVSPDALPDGIVDRQYTGELEAREGDGPFTWTLTGGSLPPGMTLDTQPTTATIPVTGTPESTGEFTFTVEVEDGDGHTAEQEITLTINPPPPIGDDGNGGSSGTGCTAAQSGLPWLILYGALTLTAAVILRRRVVGA